MSRKFPLIFISGWLTTLTFVLFICDWWDISLSGATQTALFLLAVGPPVIWAVWLRRESKRSVTQILYDQENEAPAIAPGESR